MGGEILWLNHRTASQTEGIEAGTAKLVGPYTDSIVMETEQLLYDKAAYNEMARAINPYGDGKAAKRIVEILLSSM